MAIRLAVRLFDDHVGDQLVAAALLVLLAAGMEVAGVDDRQRRGPLAVLAEAFGKELVVPQAHRLQALAPGGKHADGGAAAGFHQPATRPHNPARDSPRRAVRNRSFMAAAPSSRWPTSRPIMAAGSRPTALRTENRPPTPSGMGKTSVQPMAAASSRSRPVAPVTAMTRLASFSASPPHDFAQRLEEEAEGDGRFQRAAALADDDDAPVVARLRPDPSRPWHGVVVEVVALEVDPRPAAAPLPGKLVVVGMAAGLEQRPGAHVRAADAQHHHAIDFARQAVAGRDDPVQQWPLGPAAARAGRRKRRPTAASPRPAPPLAGRASGRRPPVPARRPAAGPATSYPPRPGPSAAQTAGRPRGHQAGIVVGDGGEGLHGGIRGQGQ